MVCQAYVQPCAASESRTVRYQGCCRMSSMVMRAQGSHTRIFSTRSRHGALTGTWPGKPNSTCIAKLTSGHALRTCLQPAAGIMLGLWSCKVMLWDKRGGGGGAALLNRWKAQHHMHSCRVNQARQSCICHAPALPSSST